MSFLRHLQRHRRLNDGQHGGVAAKVRTVVSPRSHHARRCRMLPQPAQHLVVALADGLGAVASQLGRVGCPQGEEIDHREFPKPQRLPKSMQRRTVRSSSVALAVEGFNITNTSPSSPCAARSRCSQ